jgi:subtilisin family serine protease
VIATFAGVAAVATMAPTAASATADVRAARPAPTAAYIVTLEGGTGDVAATATRQLAEHGRGARPDRLFRSALRGYTASLSPAAAADLAAAPGVAAVERDAPVALSVTRTGATWGLDRIDQRDTPLSRTYTYTRTGAGVTAYVIDTGIRFGHNDFGGRAVSGYDAIDGGTADDCNGHGTHVSSTVGGTTYGVANRTRLVGVRVLDCAGSGSTSGVIAGIDWAVVNHQAGQPAVANMSLGGGASSAMDAAVNGLIADGVTVVVAAGNSGADACNASPARVPAAITVAASTSRDAFATYSNRGSCVDIIAPGSGVTGAWSTSNTATSTINGTSMASPHAAGVAAKVIEVSPQASPATVASTVMSTATLGTITGVPGGTPNRFLFTNT